MIFQTILDSPRAMVLVGGSVRAATESARRAGLAPIAIDAFGDRETRQAAEHWMPLKQNPPSELADLCRLPIRVAGGLAEPYPWLMGLCSRQPGSNGRLLEQVDDPEFLSRMADHSGTRFPPTRTSGVGPAGWLLKRRSSSGGLGVRRINADQPIPENHFAQAWAKGALCGASFDCDGTNGRLVAVCRLLTKRIGNRPFVFAGAVGPIQVPLSVAVTLKRLGDAVVQATQIVGPLNIDVTISPDRVSLLEINPRYSASMEIVELDLMDQFDHPVSFYDSDSIPRETPKDSGPRWIKRVLFASEAIDLVPEQLDTIDLPAGFVWKDVPHQRVTVEPGHPIATLIGQTAVRSLAKSLRMVDRLSQRLH